MRTIGRYDNLFEANLVKGVLEDAGIKAAILNQNSPYPLNSDLFNVELVVNDEDYELAEKILAASPKAE